MKKTVSGLYSKNCLLCERSYLSSGKPESKNLLKSKDTRYPKGSVEETRLVLSFLYLDQELGITKWIPLPLLSLA